MCQKEDKIHIEFHRKYNISRNDNSLNLNVYQQNNKKGWIGLGNLGNTCYMNSIIQCLSNTKLLRIFFLKKLNLTNEEAQLCWKFRSVLQRLWINYDANDDSKYVSSLFELREVFVAKSPQFNNDEPQDAQEFLLNFLDRLNEELKIDTIKSLGSLYEERSNQSQIECPKNIIKDNQNSITQNNQNNLTIHYNALFLNKLENKVIVNRRKTVLFNQLKSDSHDHFHNKKIRDESIITDLFYGQFHTGIKCKTCHNTTHKHELFSVLELGIPPTKYMIQLPILLLDTSIQIFLCTSIFQRTRFSDLKDFITQKYPCLLMDVLTCSSDKYYHVLSDTQDHNIWNLYEDKKHLSIYEKPSNGINSFVIFNKANTLPYRLILHDLNITIEDIICQIKRDIIIHQSKQPTVNQIIQLSIQKEIPNSEKCECSKKGIHFCEIKDHKRSLNGLGYNGSSIILFKIKIFDYLFQYESMIQYCQKTDQVDLNDCLEYFQLNETIEEFNCETCQKKTSVDKKMTIDISPRILVIQLQRFENVKGFFGGIKQKKNKAFVDINPCFPLDFTHSMLFQDPIKYKLYSVVQHHTNFSIAGHYTAICRNNDKWVEYNDKKVKEVTYKDINKKSLYLLFYEKI